MKVAMRVDASPAMGSGHLVRCLCLADALQEHGAEVLFVCHTLPAHLAAQVAAHGHSLVRLPRPHTAGEAAPQAPWPLARQQEDASATAALLQRATTPALTQRGRELKDWLVVDHYGLDYVWETQMRNATQRLMVIDDLARTHDCDLLLDQNFHPDPNARYATGTFITLLGPRYALLRPEFAQARAHVAPRDGAVGRLLVFMGGMDADNVTGLVLQAITQLNRPALRIDVVIGTNHPAQQAIEAFCESRPGAQCHVQTFDMAGLLARADLAVGAGGSATWERCALGVPTLALALVDNQRELLASAARHGFVYAPDGLPTAFTLAMHIDALLDNTALRSHLSRTAFALVDGKGAQRVAAALLSTNITVRPAVAADCADIYAWRNAPSVRSASHSSEVIAFEAHQRWFEDVLRSSTSCLLVGERGGQGIGVVRFDIEQAQATVSIYLLESQLGQGVGPDLLLAAEAWLAAHRAEVHTLRAQTLPANLASQRLFERCGYAHDAIHFFKRISTP